MRSGFALIELLVVMLVAAILIAIALPRLAAMSDAAAVRTEIARLVAAIDRTRGAAERLGVVTTLSLSDTAYRAGSYIDPDTIVAFRAPGPAASGVGISGTGQPIAFGPAGLAMGVANRTITLSRGAVSRQVVLSRLGRLTY